MIDTSLYKILNRRLGFVQKMWIILSIIILPLILNGQMARMTFDQAQKNLKTLHHLKQNVIQSSCTASWFSGVMI